MALMLQQIIEGRTTIRQEDKGKPISGRRLTAIVLDDETGELFTLPWDSRTKKPIISIDTLRKMNPGLGTEAKQALRRAPRHKVNR